MSQKKIWPDRFSRFYVYWIQTNRQTDKQTPRQTSQIYIQITKHRFLKIYLKATLNKSAHRSRQLRKTASIFKIGSQHLGLQFYLTKYTYNLFIPRYVDFRTLMHLFQFQLFRSNWQNSSQLLRDHAYFRFSV